MKKKFRFYQEIYPEVKDEGYHFCCKNEVYMLEWYSNPFNENGRQELQTTHFELYRRFPDAEMALKKLLKKEERYKGFELCECEYHDWGIRYVAVEKDWEQKQRYLLFYIRFEPIW
jgi:hypothetical protein